MKSCSIVAFLSLLIVGCGSDIDVSYSRFLPPNVQKLKNDAVFANVDGSKLTKGDVLVNISILKKLSEHRAGKPLEESRVKAIANNVLANVISHFTLIASVSSITRTNGVEVAEDRLQSQEDGFYGSFIRPGEQVSAVRGLLNKTERDFISRLASAQVAFDAYIAENCSNDLQVAEADIDAAMKRINDWNDMVAKTNAFAYSMASNIVKWVNEGKDFAELADKYSQDPDKKPGGLIDDHAAVSFFNGRSSYLETLDLMPKGKVSDILPSIEGLLIVKALGKDPKTGMPLYQRIVLQTGEPYQKLSRKDLRQIGENELMQALQNRLVATVRAAGKIEFPYGENVLKGRPKGPMK